MKRSTIKAKGPSASTSVASPGGVSAVGPSRAAPKPRIKNTRDYGKAEQPAEPSFNSPNPFGSVGGF